MVRYRKRLSFEGREDYNKEAAKRMRKLRAQRKLTKKEERQLEDDNSFNSSYRNRQARAKAILRVVRQLPGNPERSREVVRAFFGLCIFIIAES
jgi:hypothetical protein